ncbi:MAG TPA: type II secretion system protein [Candidatus Paceibacterota bacterium]|nr:type II secretion system protein [Candidatus Paceibacterota bacterium]
MKDIFKKIKNILKDKKGFTLVEMIVAMSVFTVLLTVAVGVFVKSIRSQRELVHRLAIIDNAGLALEQMTREIRTGYDFTANDFLKFKNKDGKTVNFLKASEQILRRVDDENFELTSPNVRVKTLSFDVQQANDDKCNPWRVTIGLRVGSEELQSNDDIVLQTTVSSRVLPVEMPNASQEILNDCKLSYD